MKTTVKRLIIILPLLVLAVVALVFSCTPYSSEDIAYKDEIYHEQVCEYLENEVYSTWSELKYKPICEYYYLGADNNYIYAYTMGTDFRKTEHGLDKTNSSQIPMRIKYKLNQEMIELEGFAFPPDGRDFTKSLFKLFPTYVRTGLVLSNEERKNLSELVRKRACEYFGLEYVPNN